MNRDPLEELFGPLGDDGDDFPESDTTPTEANSAAETRAFEPTQESAQQDPLFPAPRRATAATQPIAATQPVAATQPSEATTPMPAPVRSAPRQAPLPGPVRTRSTATPADDVPTGPVRSGRGGMAKALPWIVIGAVAVIALIVALVFVNSTRAGDEPTTTPTAPTTEPTTKPVEPTEEPEEEPEEEAQDSDEAPRVDVGPNPIQMNVDPAGISIETSTKLGEYPGWYVVNDPQLSVMLHTNLMGSFPESCSAMRSVEGKSPWGIAKGEDGKWTVIRPEGSCAADPKLYDEVWGLMQGVADSAKPL